MLTEADKKIIARDGKLAGLPALLDSELLLTKLQAFPRLSHATSVEIQYLRYKPNNSCACTLRVKLADGSQQYYYAKALTQERFAESWSRPSRQKLVAEGGPFAPLAIFELNIMLLHPAHDREIGHLKWLIDEKQRNLLLKACSLPQVADEELKVDILRYKPERRLVARVKKGSRTLAVLRTATPDEFSKMLVGNTFGMAQGGVHLIGADGANCTLATNWQKGYSFCPEDGVLPTAEQTKKLAKRLVRIHRTAYKHPKEYGVTHELKSLKGVLKSFKHILPEQADWFSGLIDKIENGFATVEERYSLIHGDFSLDQVVQRTNKEGKTKIHVLDWDRSANGNPLMDLASFQARLELQVIEGVIPRWHADEIIRIFFHNYSKRSGIELKGLYWFTASAVLRLGAEPFRKRNLNWEQYTLQLLQRAEEIIAQGDLSYTRAHRQAVDFSQDFAIKTLTDAPKMQALLREKEILSEEERIETTVLRRYKPKRRALVDYKAVGSDGIRCFIGKYRAKGMDKRSYRVQKALWKAGFDERSQVSVPKVIGKISELNTWFQQRVNGQSMEDILLPDNGRLAFWGRALANALNRLHQSGVAEALELPVWTVADELNILRDRLAKAQEFLPQLAARIAKVSADCESLAEKLSSAPLVSVHRDFYQDQALELYGKPGHIVLLDLDLVARGPAALDAGNFIAHIHEFALRRYADINALNVLIEAFGAQFLAGNHAANKDDAEIYTVLSLARHIYISTLFEDRKHTTETLVKVCEERLASYLKH